MSRFKAPSTPLNYLIFECHSPSGHDLFALCTFGGELFLKASYAIHVCLIRNDEGFGPHLCFANHALKTLVVPFTRFVLHFLHAW